MTSAKVRGRERGKEHVESLQNVEPRKSMIAGFLAELSSLAEIGYEEEKACCRNRGSDRRGSEDGEELSAPQGTLIGGQINEVLLIAQLHAGGD